MVCRIVKRSFPAKTFLFVLDVLSAPAEAECDGYLVQLRTVLRRADWLSSFVSLP
jgi:hypothetical protein